MTTIAPVSTTPSEALAQPIGPPIALGRLHLENALNIVGIARSNMRTSSYLAVPAAAQSAVAHVMRGWGELAKVSTLDATVGASLINAATRIQQGSSHAERAHFASGGNDAFPDDPDFYRIELNHRSDGTTRFDEAVRSIQSVLQALPSE